MKNLLLFFLTVSLLVLPAAAQGPCSPGSVNCPQPQVAWTPARPSAQRLQAVVRVGCRYRRGQKEFTDWGSGTIIVVSETQVLVLSCKHVIRRPGRYVKAYWPNVPGGFTSYGWSIDVGGTQDIAAFITQRPPGVRPVRVQLPRIDSGPFTNVGFPSGGAGLEWQQGKFGSLSHSEFYYTVARPVPGMSGGATFDRFGNLVGVIVR